MECNQEHLHNNQLPNEWEKDNFINNVTMENFKSGESLNCVNSFVNVEKLDINSSSKVKGRLRENISFWESIGANNWVLKIIRVGYSLPFIDMPKQVTLANHNSALGASNFVSKEIEKLLLSGALVEVKEQEVTVCSPLGVVYNRSGKHRLILDLRYVNKHLRSCKFKYEDIRTATTLFTQGDWFFKFDYTSGYHHIEIFPPHTTFLGCSWKVNGSQNFFKFTVFPFGLSTGPYVFSKIQRVLVKHWRGKGIRIFTYLDDGAGAESSKEEAQKTSMLVQHDVAQSGFVAHNDKCQWEPCQSGELLGFIMDLQSGTFSVPPKRVEHLRRVLQEITVQEFITSARNLSRLTGLLVSMGLALGPVVRLRTRGLYRQSSNPYFGILYLQFQTRPRGKFSFGQRTLIIVVTPYGLPVQKPK
ncbi:uncharacterized protein LOC114542824 [Dendronephthya gigantea]|uniref:uncharacterized protein LOC114542824 n=1 Tax=Dendronephthya gigantea TaxID=151771 RepID=UPI0010696828|nr:uncharacterized protein LOC114542824 [Dendronephthya gigantea]